MSLLSSVMDAVKGFKNYPKSVSEHKSDITGDASDWTPRDLLIKHLRSIDEGEPELAALIVIKVYPDGDISHSVACEAGINKYTLSGLLTAVSVEVLEAD